MPQVKGAIVRFNVDIKPYPKILEVYNNLSKI
jgi:hypothetical protein